MQACLGGRKVCSEVVPMLQSFLLDLGFLLVNYEVSLLVEYLFLICSCDLFLYQVWLIIIRNSASYNFSLVYVSAVGSLAIKIVSGCWQLFLPSVFLIW